MFKYLLKNLTFSILFLFKQIIEIMSVFRFINHQIPIKTNNRRIIYKLLS